MADVLRSMVGEKCGKCRRRSAPCTRATTRGQPVSEDSSQIHRVVLQIAGRILSHNRVDFRRRRRHRQPVQPWREQPRPWPQAWQAKRPVRVVAHATGLLLATASATAPPGGRHGAPPDDDGLNRRDDLQLANALAASERPSSTSKSPRRRAIRGEHLARGSCSPTVFPPLSL